VYTGTEFGPWSAVLEAVIRLEKRLPEARIHDLLVMGSTHFWRALNGRFVGELIFEIRRPRFCLKAIYGPLRSDCGHALNSPNDAPQSVGNTLA
jgi:hypothetical protein